MNKAVLIMDVPEGCGDCVCFENNYDGMYCAAICRKINLPSPDYFRQEWCPLKELPERRKYNEEHFNGDVKGWNDCLKTILGDKNV